MLSTLAETAPRAMASSVIDEIQAGIEWVKASVGEAPSASPVLTMVADAAPTTIRALQLTKSPSPAAMPARRPSPSGR